MLTKKFISASFGAALTLGALVGCDDAGSSHIDSADRAEDNDSSADFEISELKAVSAGGQISSCEQAAQCVRSAPNAETPTEACRTAAQACMKELAGHTSTLAKDVGECRQHAVACVKGGGERETCRAEFTTCAKAAFEGATGVTSTRDAGAPHRPTLPARPTTPRAR